MFSKQFRLIPRDEPTTVVAPEVGLRHCVRRTAAELFAIMMFAMVMVMMFSLGRVRWIFSMVFPAGCLQIIAIHFGAAVKALGTLKQMRGPCGPC